MSKVQAWTHTNPSYPTTLTLTSVPTPDAPPTPTSILVRTRAAALNPVDIRIMNLPLNHLPKLNAPKVAGCDVAGTVIAAGPESGFSKGHEVMGLLMKPGEGTLKEVLVVDTKKAPAVVKKPTGWTWTQAASLPLVWLTARTLIENIGGYVRNGRVVVLGGSSAVGMHVVHLAKQRGWFVLSSCSARNTEFVRSMGANETVDYTKESVSERVRAWKPDTIVDCVGGTECIGIAPRYVTIVGDEHARESMGGPILYFTMPKMLLRWFWGRIGWGEAYDCIYLEENKAFLEEALQLPTDKIIIDSTFKFEDTKDAYDRLNTGRARGKVVVEVGKSS
ncbi:NAD(P)-binding protein [Patellaria atrata CBS 101060]|uniref:NAD(P)-binding protein n=1 Tax=Patellaria atrata CBS 101060 TaxID=1346257 RepID=A0A9P4VNM6_9PEZI|nr:NAD(P)-binding protein [Patellaria atrata CBS 101060]